MIRMVDEKDATEITDIYNHYVLTSTATFEVDTISVQDMKARIAAITGTYPWLVLEEDGGVAGYAYASTFRERAAYHPTVESSIYFSPSFCGKGGGSRLYAALIDEVRTRGFHSLIGVLALPNPASVALHRKMGFSCCGVLLEAGHKFGAYVDVAYYQLVL